MFSPGSKGVLWVEPGQTADDSIHLTVRTCRPAGQRAKAARRTFILTNQALLRYDTCMY